MLSVHSVPVGVGRIVGVEPADLSIAGTALPLLLVFSLAGRSVGAAAVASREQPLAAQQS